MAANIIPLSPLALESQVYSPQDLNLIQSSVSSSYFNPNTDYIEYTISSIDGNYQITDVTYNSFSIYNTPEINSGYSSIDVNIEGDLIAKGFTTGEWTVEYAFYHAELSSSLGNLYYIKEISPDRTEIRLASNTLSNVDIQTGYDEFITKYNNSVYFQDFYLNFGNNNLIIANNLLLDTTVSNYEILVNLYEPLPSQFNVKDTLWVVTKVADPLSFRVQFVPELTPPPINYINIKGPNVDIPIKDKINNSSNYINYEQLLTTGLISSYGQILSYLNDKSINISIDYSNFEDFVHFSSAKARVENFYYKVQLIEQYNSEITTLEIVGSSSITTSNITQLQEKVDNIIKNFDGFEYYQYFSSGSDTYPKGNSTPPYDLFYSLSPEVLTWLGSDNYDSPYYGGLLLSASNFDAQNQDYLINTIPDYLRDDPQNDPYTVFINMIGQHYDNIWIYYKDVSNRYDGDNRLNYGVSKDLVADALRSFGLKIYQNNFSTSDLFNAFTGYNFVISGSSIIGNNGNVYVVSPYVDEGSLGYFIDDLTFTSPYEELITDYIVSPLEGAYLPLDDINKEIYKRLYHNLPYLLKTKGTITGLRALIGVYGIPDIILRISEFGGRDRDNTTYDYLYERYNYAFNNLGFNNWISSSFPLNNSWASMNNRPEAIQLRFKTIGFPHIDAPASQSIFRILENSAAFTSPALILTYTGSGYTTASYAYPDSGSNYSPEYQYAKLDFIPNPVGYPNESASVYLPFFDNDWWSVMISRTGTNNFTLYAGNKVTYNGYDGNQIGFLASSSVTSTSHNYGTADVFFLGVSNTFTSTVFDPYSYFSGSFQELRFWADPLNKEAFRDFVMNPSSTDVFYSEDQDYADYLAFRAPLGNELFLNSSSIHPKISGSWNAITQSFSTDSNFGVRSSSFDPNVETFFLNSPIAGLRNRVTDKIQIVSSSYPPINVFYTQSGNTLTQYRRIEQNYVSQTSESPDVNALEVAFSPTNEIDDDIVSSLGYFNIGEYIGDPRQVKSREVFYPDLNDIRDTYFQKYYDNYDLIDYIRLIKFFDNSLFKMIKDFVPARTNLRSGVVIKQHLLERNKYPQPLMEWEDVTYSGSIDTAFITGSTGGTFNEFNNLYFTQSWYETTLGPTGSTQLLHDDQSEFYNGELPGTIIDPTNGELNEANVFKYPSTLEINYSVFFYNSSYTPINDFFDINTSPNQGEVYLWYDTGSILNPGQNVPIPGPGGG